MDLEYLQHYGAELREQVRELITAGRLGEVVRARYPTDHTITSNPALYDYAMGLKRKHMASSPPLRKVVYCDKISTLKYALGLNKRISRVQGARLGATSEIRIASVFRKGPGEFLEAIVVHELAHLRVREHDKAFYRLCQHMLPDYHQVEFDMRLWLTQLALEAKAAKAESAGP